jgi:hypothetical protein
MNKFLLLLLCLAFISCVNEKKEEEDNLRSALPADSVIPPAIMVQLLADVHIIEAGLQLQKNHGVDIRNNARDLYYGVFHKYHISRERYDLNLEYYRQDPEAFAKFYELVEHEITARQNDLTKGKTKAPPHKGE